MKCRMFLTLAAVLLAGPILDAQETRAIIPVFASGVEGGQSTWNSVLWIHNPTAEDAVVELIGSMPDVVRPCSACSDTFPAVIRSQQTVYFADVVVAGRSIKSGAFEIEGSAPIAVGSNVLGSVRGACGGFARSEVPVVSDFLEPGSYLFPQVYVVASERGTLFLSNPSRTIPVQFTIGFAHGPKSTVEVPPMQMTTIPLRYPEGQSFPPDYPYRGVAFQLEANGVFMAVISQARGSSSVTMLPSPQTVLP